MANFARAITLSLGSYEHDRAISDTERQSKDKQLNVAVNYLCTASGIFTYIADTVLLEWESNASSSLNGFAKPPELSREVNSALAKRVSCDLLAPNQKDLQSIV